MTKKQQSYKRRNAARHRRSKASEHKRRLFTDQQLCVVAALFTRLSSGHSPPSVTQLRVLFENPHVTLGHAVMVLCGNYFTHSASQEAFEAEARSWFRNKEISSLVWVRVNWPQHADLISAAMGPVI